MLQDGYSQRRIASTLCVSRNTVAKVVKAASDHRVSKDALESMEEMEIHNTLFPGGLNQCAYCYVWVLRRCHQDPAPRIIRRLGSSVTKNMRILS